jgi:hypothetical protein
MIAAALRAGITTTAAAPTRPPAHRSQVPLPYYWIPFAAAIVQPRLD